MKKINDNEPKKAIHVMVPVRLPEINTLFPNKTMADRVRAILQLLFFILLRMRSNSHFAGGVNRATGYCPVNSKVIKTIAGNGYRKIIERMVELEIIQVKINEETGNESFLPHTWSKLYRIHPKQKMTFQGRSYRREQITHPDVIRAVKRNYDLNYSEQLKGVAKKGKLYADIVRYGDKFRIDIQRLELDIKSGITKDDVGLIGNAIAINEQQSRWCHMDEFGKRLHTHLGNMPKELRPYIILKDKKAAPLVLVDVKNSQPYFLSLLFYKPELLSLIPEFESLRSVLEQNRKQPDVRLFYEDCVAGEFYNKALVVIGQNKVLLKEIPDEEKKKLKKKLFQHIFYCSPGNYHREHDVREERQQIQSRFTNVYPGLMANLKGLKRIKKTSLPLIYELTRKGKSKGKMYATPNCMAQRIESKVILEFIATEMFRLNAPVFTIHDAFILEEQHVELLNRILNDIFKNKLGVKPPKLDLTRLTTGQQ